MIDFYARYLDKIYNILFKLEKSSKSKKISNCVLLGKKPMEAARIQLPPVET